MKFQPSVAIPLSLLAVACSSSQFNSLLEARDASWEWKDQGERITIAWTERNRKTEEKTVTLTEEEYEIETEKNNQASFKYAKDLEAKRDALARTIISKMRVSEGFLDSPNLENTREWKQVRFFVVHNDLPCKETEQVVCVTQSKIAARIPSKTKQVVRSFWVDTKKELTFRQRDCTHEEETKQFVCWSLGGQQSQFNAKDEKEAEALRASIKGKKNYRYFRY